MGARLFTALIPPASVVETLEAFVEPRRGADDALRWTRTESWHITTSFLPSVTDRSFERLVEGLADAARAHAPIDVTVGGAGAFHDPTSARVLYLAAQPADEVGRLAASCRRAAVRAGTRADGARFVPHLTLARCRRPLEATRWLRVLDACPSAMWRSDELALVESHPSDAGNRYEVLERFALGDPYADGPGLLRDR